MKTKLPFYLIFLFVFGLISNYSFASSSCFCVKLPLLQHQSEDSIIQDRTIKNNGKTQGLVLSPSNLEIEHVFTISMSKQDFSKLSKTKNLEKDYLSDCKMIYNKDSLDVKKIELRGQNSMFYKRKSFSVSLNKKLTITKNGKKERFKKFNLISLSMDQNYFRNKVAFDLMSKIGLFNLFYKYVEVIVNGKTQGVYLFIEKPKGYAFKKENADFMLRREYDNKIKKTYINKKASNENIERYEAFFNKIYNDFDFIEGEEYYNRLSIILDLDQYLDWMAFNYLIGNGDYTDEVFFYNKMTNKTIKFGIIPWDYDDVFRQYPHEGSLIRYFNFGNKLAFSSEDALDFKLINDVYTYSKYLENLRSILEKLTATEIKQVFEKTYHQLYPYYKKKAIIAVSKSDLSGKTDLIKLKIDMQNTYNQLINKRRETITKLNEELSSKE